MSLRKPLLAFAGVAALSALAFAPMVAGGDIGDGKAQAAAAGAAVADATATTPLAADLSLVDCAVGVAGPFACDNVDLVDVDPTVTFGGGHGSDSWGWTDEDGTEYVIVTSGNGVGFFRLAEDGTTDYLGTLALSVIEPTGILWHDVKVVNDHAYITAEDADYGVQIVDLTKLRDMTAVDPVGGVEQTLEQDGFIDGLQGHNMVGFPERDLIGIVLGEDAECGGQLVFFDVAETPTEPQRVGCIDNGIAGIGNVPVGDNEGLLGGRVDPHDAHCVVYDGPDADYNGAGDDGAQGTDDDVAASDVCALFSQESGGLILVDVSDITRDRSVDLADGGKGGEVINRFTYPTMNYTHQGWFTDDHEFVMFNDELDESGALALGAGGGAQTSHNAMTTTYWVDVSDLDVGVKQTDPSAIYGQGPLPTDFRVNEDLVKAWSNPNTVAIDHNMYPVTVDEETGRGLLYQANYGAGLRVLEFTPASLRGPAEDGFEEVAYFDTYPGPGPAEFYGAWNVYPFFESGNVILSDFQSGLLVLDVHDDVLED